MSMPGSPGERDAVGCSGFETGRRRAIGVVAALPATSARPRRWCDAGPLGRKASQRPRRPGMRAASGTAFKQRLRRCRSPILPPRIPPTWSLCAQVGGWPH